jgi:hypothetical protein
MMQPLLPGRRLSLMAANIVLASILGRWDQNLVQQSAKSITSSFNTVFSSSRLSLPAAE